MHLLAIGIEEIEGDRSGKIKPSRQPYEEYRAVACTSDGCALLQNGGFDVSAHRLGAPTPTERTADQLEEVF